MVSVDSYGTRKAQKDMAKKQKLELTWIGKHKRARLETRVLIEDRGKSYHATIRHRDDDIFDNILIKGDNLLALKALEADYAGQVKCIYIDPPYNIRVASPYYDDGLEHSQWLFLMKARLELLWKLLCSDGFMAVQIDDTEFARLFLLMCEVCGEKNLKIICVKMSESTGVKMASINKAGGIAKLKEFIILAGKNGIKGLKLEKIPKTSWDDEYKTFVSGLTREEINTLKVILDDTDRTDNDILVVDKLLKKIKFEKAAKACKRLTNNEINDDWLFENSWRIIQFVTLTGGAKDIAVTKKLGLSRIPAAFGIVTKTGKMYAVRGSFNHNSQLPRCKILFADQYLDLHPGDFWSDIKTTGLENEGGVKFKNGKKPEKLIERIIGMATEPRDLVLDSFAGSGTTGAVAHKMGRRWIMVELGKHCDTHAVPRLQKVIDGKDQSGVSKALDWKGGGGFRYYTLAPSLLEKDAYDSWVISKKYNPEMLSEAVCKLMGFTYAPSQHQDTYWQHGYSSETDFIYVTTNALTQEAMAKLSADVGPERTLKICCRAFKGNADIYNNLTIEKIPHAVLKKCEWGHDDYSLNIANLPMADKNVELPMFGASQKEKEGS